MESPAGRCQRWFVTSVTVAPANRRWTRPTFTPKRFGIGAAAAYPGAMSGPATPAQWLARAAEARAAADAMQDATAKRTMLAVAAGYEKMARYAAALASTRLPTEESDAGRD
jgi:hypothetical protein